MDCKNPELSAFLFPHSHVSETEVKRVLSFFDGLTILQPWHMEDRLSIPPGHGLKLLHPPEHLKPMEGFQSLLSEYKNWMREHSDKGYASAAAALRQHGRSGDATWEIRRSIREPGEEKPGSRAHATRWHLLLHLARESEERLREAGEVLRILKEKGSPLRDAVGEGEPQGLLDDLYDFDADREPDPAFIETIAQAWLGLFGGMIGREALVTLSPRVFEKIAETFKENAPVIRFIWPDLSTYGWEELHLKRGELGSSQPIAPFRDAVRGFLGDPAADIKGLRDLARDLDSALPKNQNRLDFRVLRLGAVPGSNWGIKSLAGLGRLLFLVETPGHG